MVGDNSFSTWLRNRRKTLDLTQAALGREMGCSASLIRKMEAGSVRPSRQVAALLADFLAVPAGKSEAFINWARTGNGTHEASAWTIQPLMHPAPGHDAPLRAQPPHPPTSLIGREADMATIRDLLTRGDVRLLTLKGPPGTGKTRLAIELALDPGIQSLAPDGVFFIELASLTDPALFLEVVAGSISHGETALHDADPMLSLSAHFSQSRSLLVLDNFEQIIPAGVSVAALLAAAPDLKVLVTSRERLSLRAEHVYAVPPLAVPPPQDDEQTISLDTLETVSSVALFVQRGAAVQPGFALQTENARDIAAICERLEGIPLSIELAAGWLPILSPATLLQRLDHRLFMLDNGAADLPDRHRTLNNAISSSYTLLNTDEQKLFRAMSVFARGCSLDAVESLWTHTLQTKVGQGVEAQPPHTVLSLLSALARKSMLRQETQGEEPRYLMLETIREFALAHSEAEGELDSALGWHADYYTYLLERLGTHLGALKGNHTLQSIKESDLSIWSAFEHEQANVREALRYLVQTQNGASSARLALAVVPFWRARGHASEGRMWLDRVLRIGAHLPGQVMAHLLQHAGMLAFRQADNEEARRLLETSLSLFQKGANIAYQATVLQDIARLDVVEDRYETADAHLSSAISLYTTDTDDLTLCRTLHLRGFLALSRGDMQAAGAMFSEAQALAVRTGNPFEQTQSRHFLGLLAFHLGDYTEATALFKETCEQYRGMGVRNGVASSLAELGQVALVQRDYGAAKDFLLKAIDEFRVIGSRVETGVMRCILGSIFAYCEDLQEARRSLHAGLILLRDSNLRYDLAICLMCVAAMLARSARYSEAALIATGSQSQFNQLGVAMNPVVHMLSGDVEKATETLDGSALTRTRESGEGMSLSALVEHALTIALEPNPVYSDAK